MQMEISKLKGQLEEKDAANKRLSAAKSGAAPKSKDKDRKDKKNDKLDKTTPPELEVPEVDAGQALPEAAKQARLRRLCERKPSGKIFAPLEVHEKWRTGTKDDREQMLAKLESSGWDKDRVSLFISTS